ncbi:MAG: tyrosine-type recombinase/integrase [Bacteroidota bacterium]
MSLQDYLSRYYSASTARLYRFEIDHYLAEVGSSRASQAGYRELLAHLSSLRDRYENTGTLHRILQAIKCYYRYLLESGVRDDHPAKNISLRDVRPSQIQLQDLLTEIELQALLLPRQERYPMLARRNRVVMSLLVNQALALQEMAALKVQDIDLEKATIQASGTAKLNTRKLRLKADQILLLHDYLEQDRPQLLRTSTDALILTSRGTAERGEGIHYLVETYRAMIPGKKLTPTTIRQSVLHLRLQKGEDLRHTQAFAGHKNPSSTEQYRQSRLEVLRRAVEQYHPLGQSGNNLNHH